MIHDKIRHLPEDRLGNLKITEDVIRTIVYQSEPGIKYIARKVNLDKEKLKKAMKNVWVTKGYKMKEQIRNTVVQINEEEIGKLPEKKFRIMIVKMIKNPETKMEKMQESINKDLEVLKNKQTGEQCNN